LFVPMFVFLILKIIEFLTF